MTGFKFLFLGLTFLPLAVRAASITNITRITTGRLLELSTNLNDGNFNGQVIRILKVYARSCCIMYYPEPSRKCDDLQMAYYAHVPVNDFDDDNDFINYVIENYNPDFMDATKKNKACGRDPLTTAPEDRFYPYFAFPIRNADPPLHSETQLLKVMKKRAEENPKNYINFWLYTYQSPCVRGSVTVANDRSCLKSLFYFLPEVEVLYTNLNLNLGFYKWFTWDEDDLEVTFDISRERFCGGQTGSTGSVSRGVDFWKWSFGLSSYYFEDYLSFTKINEEGTNDNEVKDSVFLENLHSNPDDELGFHC